MPRERSRSRGPLLDTPEFWQLLRQVISRPAVQGRMGCTKAEILQYADAMMANYPDSAQHMLATCRLLRGIMADQVERLETRGRQKPGLLNLA